MKPVGPNDKSVPNLAAATTPIADSDLALVYQGSALKQTARSNLVRAIPVDVTLINGGSAGATVPFPAGVSPGTEFLTPASRTVLDLSNVTQAKLTLAMKVLMVGSTAYTVRVEYATNGITQTAWAELAATAGQSVITVQGGSLNIVRTTAWFNIPSGAKTDPAVIRLTYVSTGTATAGSVGFVNLLLK